MSEFQPIYPETINPDPYKKVKYSNGLVLGADEFEQEQVYLLAKDQLHNRSLHGYGTVCGLNVTVEDEEGDGNWEVRVSPGIAVDKVGRSVRVTQTQCARLNVWLLRHKEIITEFLNASSPALPNPFPLSIYVVLCYDECNTDSVPVPGGPCQSLDKTSVPSRVADNFKLKLQLESPEKVEEESIQTLVDLLSSIEISDAPDGLMVEEIEEMVRSLEAPASPLHMNTADTNDLITAAFRVWATEVRSNLLPNGRNCVAGPPREECILLAEVSTSVEDTASELGFQLESATDPEVIQSERPILIQSRVLQEFMQHRLATIQAEVVAEAGLNPADLVHISGAEAITGAKSFASKIQLQNNGMVEKVIHLPAYQAHHGNGAGRRLFNDVIPAMRFITDTSDSEAFNGEALFSIPIPDDINYDRGPQFRLIWGFRGAPMSAIEFQWRVNAGFFRPNDSTTSPGFESVAVPVSEVSARRNDVLVTELFTLDENIELLPEHRYGMLRVMVSDPGVAISEVYLLQVEMHYIANRLGRRPGDEEF